MPIREAIIVEEKTLEGGEVFDGLEVVVGRTEKSIVTAGWQSGIESGKEYDMRCFMYDLVGASGKIAVRGNGYREIFPDEGAYQDYAEKLKSRGIFPEE